MAQTALIVSFLSGVALVAMVAFLAGHGWRQYTPAPAGHEVGGASRVARTAEDPTVWAVAFLVIVLGTVGATVLFVGGGGALQRGAGVFLAGGAAVVLVAYLFYGTVISALGRGLANSQAVALGSSVLGLLGIVVITLRLLGLI
jgi:hypothetical protein